MSVVVVSSSRFPMPWVACSEVSFAHGPSGFADRVASKREDVAVRWGLFALRSHGRRAMCRVIPAWCAGTGSRSSHSVVV